MNLYDVAALKWATAGVQAGVLENQPSTNVRDACDAGDEGPTE